VVSNVFTPSLALWARRIAALPRSYFSSSST
jgi:hypothetical protein